MLAYRFRLYPNKEQERKMLRALEMCCLIYNRFLEEYNGGEHDYRKLSAMLPVWKEGDANLKGVYSQVLQYILHRVFMNLKTQIGLVEHGRKVGKLRYKTPQRFRSFTYPQGGFGLWPKNDKQGILHLSKIGDVPIRLHREVVGEIKQVTIKHMLSGDWYACIMVDDGKGEDELTFIEKAVGIDLGLEDFAVDSHGRVTENPHHLKRAEKKLRRDQRRLSRKKKGSKNWEKQRIIVARDYEHITNQRNDFLHKESRSYVDNNDLIVTEDLHTREMIEKGHLGQSINDAGWGIFNQYVTYKAERAGKLHVKVDPRGTSQECSCCGEIVPKTLYERQHDCPNCGLSLSRDHNASINILKRGIEKVGQELPELACGHWAATPPSMVVQARWMKQEALT